MIIIMKKFIEKENTNVFKDINVNFISTKIKSWIEANLYQSIALSTKSIHDFNIILNQTLINIVPNMVYAESMAWELIDWLNLEIKFKRHRKNTIFRWFGLRKELIYFKDKDKDVLLLNCIDNGLNDTSKIVKYFDDLFKENLIQEQEKKSKKSNFYNKYNLLDEDYMYENVNNIDFNVLQQIKNKLIPFKIILILDKDIYTNIYHHPILLNGTNILCIVYNEINDTKNETLIYNNTYKKSGTKSYDLVYYDKHLDLSLLFTHNVMYDFVKDQILSILNYDWTNLFNVNKLDNIINYLLFKRSYYVIVNYLEQLKDMLLIYKFSNKDNINYILDIIIDLLWIKEINSINPQVNFWY